MQSDISIKTGCGMSIKSNRFDDIKLGIVIGTLGPLLGVMLYYYIHQALPNEKISGLTYSGYIDMLQRPRVLATVLRGALLVNLGAFFLVLNFEWNKVSQGIIAMTIFYALLIVYLHFA